MTEGPAYVWSPPRVSSMAEPVSRLAEALGRPLYPEQRTAVEILTGMDQAGVPASLVSVLVCPRQNMKTWLFQLIALARLLEPGGARTVVWSAHELATSMSTFEDFVALREEHEWLQQQIPARGIRRSNGKEKLVTRHGKELLFKARTKSGARGLTGDLVVLDEGLYVTPEQVGALMPLLSTRKRALLLVGSSAGVEESAVLRGWRDAGRAGGVDAPAYVEFCAPGSFAEPGCSERGCAHRPGASGCVMDNREYWLAANPAAKPSSGLISMRYLVQERKNMPPAQFGVERLGWWVEPAEKRGWSVDDWDLLADPESVPEARPVGIGVDVSKGLRMAYVSAVAMTADGRTHCQLLAARPGVEWLPEFLGPLWAEHRARVRILGGSSTAVAVVPSFERHRIKYETTSFTDYAAACTLLEKEIIDGGVVHLGDEILRTAVRDAVTVPVGDVGSRWSAKKSAGDISPLAAVTLARWQLECTVKKDYGTSTFG